MYIHYKIVTKHLLRSNFVIVLSYDDIIATPKSRLITRIEAILFQWSTLGWAAREGGSHFINPLATLQKRPGLRTGDFHESFNILGWSSFTIAWSSIAAYCWSSYMIHTIWSYVSADRFGVNRVLDSLVYWRRAWTQLLSGTSSAQH